MEGGMTLVSMFAIEAQRHIMTGDFETTLACIENALCCRGCTKRETEELNSIANAIAVHMAERNWL